MLNILELSLEVETVEDNPRDGRAAGRSLGWLLLAMAISLTALVWALTVNSFGMRPVLTSTIATVAFVALLIFGFFFGEELNGDDTRGGRR